MKGDLDALTSHVSSEILRHLIVGHVDDIILIAAVGLSHYHIVKILRQLYRPVACGGLVDVTLNVILNAEINP